MCSHSKGHFEGQKGQVFKRLYLLNGACYDNSLYETHIVNHIHVYDILVDLMTLTFDDI